MTKSHQPHRLHQITPVANLAQSAAAAFNGAKYHLERARSIANEGKKQYGQFNSDKFLWEIRAFFWEMASS